MFLNCFANSYGRYKQRKYYSTSFSSLCYDDDSLVLTGGSPAGGTYSGQGVVNGVFYPSLVSPDTIEITYSYLESNSCLATRSEDLVVNPLPTVSLKSN